MNFKIKQYKSYSDYVEHQKSKANPETRLFHELLTTKWEPDCEGFRLNFARHKDILSKLKTAICLGARTGQEVYVLNELGLNSIGIDLTACPPYVIEGDVHDIPFSDNTFDFIFSNIFDHVLHPHIFVKEIKRVLNKSGYVLLHLSISENGHPDNDHWASCEVNSSKQVIDLFGDNFTVVQNEPLNQPNWPTYWILLLKHNDIINSQQPKPISMDFSLNGRVRVISGYEMSGANRKHYHYTESLINDFIEMGLNEICHHYPETDYWLYKALRNHPVAGKSVVVIGSEEPYYEGIAISKGADVTLVEYQKIHSKHPRLKTLTITDFINNDSFFDAAFSISSVEHSGLGRYGDALDPDGDIKAMCQLYNKLKPGGLCFLAVPIGLDQILWNAHRVYGRLRLPMLIEGFNILDAYGLIDSDFDIDENQKRVNGKVPHRNGVSGGAHQPVLVLQKPYYEKNLFKM